MKKPCKPCKCGCIESNHKFRDRTIDQVIEDAITSKMIEPIRSPNSIKYLGFRLIDPRISHPDKILLPDELRKEVEKFRDEHSSCKGQMFKMCSCKRFQMDNLKYLEECSERASSKIIH